MQLVLNLVASVSIKRKKPWPKLSWIGQVCTVQFIQSGVKNISKLGITIVRKVLGTEDWHEPYRLLKNNGQKNDVK
jgi:hypothetical protein